MTPLQRAHGHSGGDTMTVGELREALAQLPDDMAVVGTWESIFTPLRGVTVIQSVVYDRPLAVLNVDMA